MIWEGNNKKLKQVNALLKRLQRDFGDFANYVDVLQNYRKWFDIQGIESEGEDGWPLPFVFYEENIKKFVADWIGEEEK